MVGGYEQIGLQGIEQNAFEILGFS